MEELTEITMYHQPVLLNESVDGLVWNPSGTYVDLTFGGGGHSRAILDRLTEEGRLFAFDQDPEAVANAEGLNLTLVQQRKLSLILRVDCCLSRSLHRVKDLKNSPDFTLNRKQVIMLN